MKEKLIETLNTRFFIDYGTSYKGTVFLAGTSRSGTTWISNVINYKKQYRYMFEPFHEKKTESCKHFEEKQYIKAENREARYIYPVERILCGNVRSHWVDRFNEKAVSNKRLVKSIRANLFLKWLCYCFPDLPVILLLRHPCAVAASKVKFGWKRSLATYIRQENLKEDFLHPFYNEIKASEERYTATNDSFENHIFSWCIENYVPLQQFGEKQIKVVFYENICVRPETEVRSIFSYLKEEYDDRVLQSIRLPSQLSRKDSSIMTGESLVSGWKKDLTDHQVERAIEIVRMFGLDKLYSYDSMPHAENLKLVMKN